jgi:hypothetical protein
MKLPDTWILIFEHEGKPVTMLIHDEEEAETRARAGQVVWRVFGVERVRRPTHDQTRKEER